MPAKETKTILIVDDEPDTRIFMSNLLSSHGYNAIWAETRTEGFEKAITKNPMVIIIDMMMPGKGGIQLYKDLQREKKVNSVPVIMLSTIDRRSFFKLQGMGPSRAGTGMQRPQIYLQNPHEAEELLTTIKTISDTFTAKPKRTVSGRRP